MPSKDHQGFLVDSPVIGHAACDPAPQSKHSSLPQTEQLQITLTTLIVTGSHALAALKKDDLIALDSHLATLQDMLDLSRLHRYSKRLLSAKDCMDIAQSTAPHTKLTPDQRKQLQTLADANNWSLQQAFRNLRRGIVFWQSDRFVVDFGNIPDDAFSRSNGKSLVCPIDEAMIRREDRQSSASPVAAVAIDCPEGSNPVDCSQSSHPAASPPASQP